ncbi:MAG: hypothetical protein ACTHLL_06370 [Candidatus Nitrosocosmicus sp.]
MDNSKGNIYYSNGSLKEPAKEISPFLIPIFAILVLATGLTSINTAVYDQQANSTAGQIQSFLSSINTTHKSGTISSVQTDAQGKWNLDGAWSLNGINSGSPTFDAQFSMSKLDGSARHQHTISNFKIQGTPTTNSTGAIYKGTATVSLKNGPANNVPVTITINNNDNFSIMIDPKATSNHFGNTAIMGTVTIAA